MSGDEDTGHAEIMKRDDGSAQNDAPDIGACFRQLDKCEEPDCGSKNSHHE